MKTASAIAISLLLLTMPSFSAVGQSGTDDGMGESPVSVLTGAIYEEDLGEEEIERLVQLRTRPLKVNFASRSRLMESGLLTQYQVASLLDYRSRHGDILSLSELAAVDGFGTGTVQALQPYVSLDSDALPGKSSVRESFTRNSLLLKSAMKVQAGQAGDNKVVPSYNYGAKYKFSMNDRFDMALTFRSSYDSALFPPEAVSFYAAYYGRGALGKIIVGDYNTRFGQGLGMWSGFSMSGVPSQSAFSRRASGISPYWSYSGDGSHRGVAADFSFGDFMVSTFVSFPGLRELCGGEEDVSVAFLPGLNVAWLGMNGQASLTCYAQSRAFYAREDGQEVPLPLAGMAFIEKWMASADIRFTVKGVEIFSEAAADLSKGVAAALAGCRFRPCEGLGLAVGGRYYPADFSSDYSGAVRSGSRCSNEYGAALSGTFSAGKYVTLKGRTGFGSSVVRHQGTFSIDLSHSPEPKYGVHEASSQCKAVFSYACQISGSFALQWKISERMRTYGERFRTDVRCDLEYTADEWFCTMRVNALHCVGTGLLSYLECGCKTAGLSACIRGGLFRADNWDDRIYAYERDAPGNFSVPAFYGRGFWTSLVAGLKAAAWGRFYFRASYTGYPWLSPSMQKKKSGKAELKLQMVFNL